MDDTDPDDFATCDPDKPGRFTDILLRAVLIKYGGSVIISEHDLQLAQLAYGWQADIDRNTRKVTLELIVLPESRENDPPD